jgi:hypothetical protein
MPLQDSPCIVARGCDDGKCTLPVLTEGTEGTEALIEKQLYRLMVLWNYKRSLLVAPASIYLARIGTYTC